MKTILIVINLLLILTAVNAGESTIALLKANRSISDDLFYEGKVLTSVEAQSLSLLKMIDLSTLPPVTGPLWSPKQFSLNDQKEIDVLNNEIFDYKNTLNSNTGLFSFKAASKKSNIIFNFHLSKTLHTLLLRKNILRKLGYIIPAIKYLKKVTIEFKSIEDRNHFLKKEIPENALGEASRWVKNISELSLDLYDIAVTEPFDTDYNNVAMGIPNRNVNSRTLRSLLIPYSILDMQENINQLSWVVGKINYGKILLSHFTENEFTTNIDDAQWIIKKLTQLSRKEIKDSIDQSFFPEDVANILLEKVCSRINSLSKVFIRSAPVLFVDSKQDKDVTVKGEFIAEKKYSGYATHFTNSSIEIPFQQLNHYLYSKLKDNSIDELINKFDKYLIGYEQGKNHSLLFNNKFQNGLNQFIETGKIKPVGVASVISSTEDGYLIFTRDVVIGNYLGTDNVIQMVDTFGASIDLGFSFKVGKLFSKDISSKFNLNTSIVRTFSHISPVENLKKSFKNSYNNLFVKLLKKSLENNFFSLDELKNMDNRKSENSNKVQAFLNELSSKLAVGESLILTDRLIPSKEIKLAFRSGLLSFGLGIGAGSVTINRIHFFKKGPDSLQIYDDKGFVTNFILSFSIHESLSLLKLNSKADSGHYKINSYLVNLSSDLQKNPDFNSISFGVYNIFKSNDFEILNKTIKPIKINASFKDKSLGMSFFLLRNKSMKGQVYYNIEDTDGTTKKYFSLTKDFMTGFNAKAFSANMTKYYLSDLTNQNAEKLGLENEAPKNRFFGRSSFHNVRFDASLNLQGEMDQKILSSSESNQSWLFSPTKLKKTMMQINKKFEENLFDIENIDFQNSRYFKIGYQVNLYNKGIERLNSILSSEIDNIEFRYKTDIGCDEDDLFFNQAKCGDLGILKFDLVKCQEAMTDEKLAACNINLFDDLLKYLLFSDFKKIIGSNNIYINGTVDGFRQNSKLVRDNLFSDQIGNIGIRNFAADDLQNLLNLSLGENSGSWMRNFSGN